MVTVLGGLPLYEEEKQYLSLGPEFAQYDMIYQEKVSVNFLMVSTRIRWSRMGKDGEEVTQFSKDEDIEDEEKI